MSKTNTYFSTPIFDGTCAADALGINPRPDHKDDGKVIIVTRALTRADVAYLMDDRNAPARLTNAFHDGTIKVTTNPKTKAAQDFAAAVPGEDVGVYAVAPRGFTSTHAVVVLTRTGQARGQYTWTPVDARPAPVPTPTSMKEHHPMSTLATIARRTDGTRAPYQVTVSRPALNSGATRYYFDDPNAAAEFIGSRTPGERVHVHALRPSGKSYIVVNHERVKDYPEALPALLAVIDLNRKHYAREGKAGAVEAWERNAEAARSAAAEGARLAERKAERAARLEAARARRAGG